jgi:hypothetical protein
MLSGLLKMTRGPMEITWVCGPKTGTSDELTSGYSGSPSSGEAAPDWGSMRTSRG